MRAWAGRKMPFLGAFNLVCHTISFAMATRQRNTACSVFWMVPRSPRWILPACSNSDSTIQQYLEAARVHGFVVQYGSQTVSFENAYVPLELIWSRQFSSAEQLVQARDFWMLSKGVLGMTILRKRLSRSPSSASKVWKIQSCILKES